MLGGNPTCEVLREGYKRLMGLCVWLVSVRAQKLSPSLLGLLTLHYLYILYTYKRKRKRKRREGGGGSEKKRRLPWVFLHTHSEQVEAGFPVSGVPFCVSGRLHHEMACTSSCVGDRLHGLQTMLLRVAEKVVIARPRALIPIVRRRAKLMVCVSPPILI